MVKNVTKQLCPSQGVCQRQMTLWGFIIELPHEFCRKRPVIVLLHLSVKLLHPTNLDEELGEVPFSLVKYPLLDAVAKPVVTVLPPQLINGFEVSLRDELHLREENIATLLSRFAREDDEKAPRLFVGLLEVLGREKLAEEVEGDGLRGGWG